MAMSARQTRFFLQLIWLKSLRSYAQPIRMLAKTPLLLRLRSQRLRVTGDAETGGRRPSSANQRPGGDLPGFSDGATKPRGRVGVMVIQLPPSALPNPNHSQQSLSLSVPSATFCPPKHPDSPEGNGGIREGRSGISNLKSPNDPARPGHFGCQSPISGSREVVVLVDGRCWRSTGSSTPEVPCQFPLPSLTMTYRWAPSRQRCTSTRRSLVWRHSSTAWAAVFTRCRLISWMTSPGRKPAS